MPKSTRRVVTGHDARGKSVVLSDGAPPAASRDAWCRAQGADFRQTMEQCRHRIPELSSVEEREPNGEASVHASCRRQAACCGSWMSIHSRMAGSEP